MNFQLLNSTRNVIRSLTSYLFAKQSLANSSEDIQLLASMLRLTITLMTNRASRLYFRFPITTNLPSRPNKTQQDLVPHGAQYSVIIALSYVTNQTPPAIHHHGLILTQVSIKTGNTYRTVSKHGS